MQLFVHPPTCLPTYVPPSWALFPVTNICEGSALVLSTKYHFLLKALQKKNNKGKCVYACMQNRAIVGGNCLLAYKTEPLQGGGRVFLLCSKRKCFSITIKMLCKSYFPLNFNLDNPCCPVFTFCQGESWGAKKHRSLSHLRSRKGQHSQFAPDSLKTEIFHRPTCQEWPSCSTKSLVNFWFRSGKRNGKEKTNLKFCCVGKLFPSQLKHRLMKFHLSGIRSLTCWFC